MMVVVSKDKVSGKGKAKGSINAHCEPIMVLAKHQSILGLHLVVRPKRFWCFDRVSPRS